MSIEAMKLALAALETCRIRSVSEWSVEDITPKNVTAAIAALRTAIQQAEVTDEREAFESCPLMEGSLFKRRADDPDKYWYGGVQDVWELWQARAALSLRPERVPMTDEQINEMALQEEFLLVMRRGRRTDRYCSRSRSPQRHQAEGASMSIEAMKLALEALKNANSLLPCPLYSESIAALRTAIQQAKAQQPAVGERLMGQVSLPDGSAFAIASFPLPKDHWLYAPREYATGAGEPLELPAPILTHGQREAVVAAIRYAVRGATMCGREQDFDPDAMVQNAVYALCGPYARVSAENTQTSVNLALSQQPATLAPVVGVGQSKNRHWSAALADDLVASGDVMRECTTAQAKKETP